jgi:hypothetical protein
MSKPEETHQRIVWAVAGLRHEDNVATRSTLEGFASFDIDGGSCATKEIFQGRGTCRSERSVISWCCSSVIHFLIFVGVTVES